MAQVSQDGGRPQASGRAKVLPVIALDLSCDQPQCEMSILRIARRMRSEWRRKRYSRLRPG